MAGSEQQDSYKIGLVPGPTKVNNDILQCYIKDCPSSDLEDDDFFYVI